LTHAGAGGESLVPTPSADLKAPLPPRPLAEQYPPLPVRRARPPATAVNRAEANATARRLRVVFVVSLLLLTALVAANLATMLLGLQATYRATRTLAVANRARFRSQVIVTGCYQILYFSDSNSANATAVALAAADLQPSLSLLQLLFGIAQNGNATIGVDVPVLNPVLQAQYAVLDRLTNALASDLVVIASELNVTAYQPPLSLNATAAISRALLTQTAMLAALDVVNMELTAVGTEALNDVTASAIVFSCVILAVLLFLGVAVFLPLDRQIQYAPVPHGHAYLNRLTPAAGVIRCVRSTMVRLLVDHNEYLDDLARDLSVIMKLIPTGIVRIDAAVRSSLNTPVCTRTMPNGPIMWPCVWSVCSCLHVCACLSVCVSVSFSVMNAGTLVVCGLHRAA
jgi:hypothetical protein